MDYKAVLQEEFKIQKKKIYDAKTVVLYGNSIIACIMKIAIKELGFLADCVVFDNGRFINDEKPSIDSGKTIVILCSSRIATREGMKRDAESYFPGSFVSDFYAIYYSWIINIVRRKCDYGVLAETLLLCREENCIHNIDSINTLFCNLRCKECHNGIPQRKEKKRIEADSQIYHLSRITDKLPISQCNFQGGGVFTDVSFADFVEKHSHNARIAIFTIATNGTILPNDKVFQVIKSTGSMIRISDYGEISKQKQAIIDKCSEFDIPCFTFPMAEKWRKFGDYKKRNRSESELRKICADCCFGTHDMMFVDDKIFCCLRTLFASAVGDDNSAMTANTLNLDSDFTIEELKDFVHGKDLWRMCDYCDYPMEIIEPAEQL